MQPGTKTVTHTLQAYPSKYLTVVDGYNLGAEISFATELTLDDIYAISDDAKMCNITVAHHPNGKFFISPISDTGKISNCLHFDCIATLMSAQGDVIDVIILVEASKFARVHATYFLPLVRFEPDIKYTLIGISDENPQARYGEHALAAFAKGTHITLPTGEQQRIENLMPGDKILTRTDGVQELKWISNTTVRASGDFAPVRIRSGVLNNSRDLVVSPEHRLFIYQKSDKIGVGRREVLVAARHLVNGSTIAFEPGGYIDYFQLLFDEHQIVYAEGISAETLRVTPRNRHTIPPEICEKANIPPEGHARRNYDQYEIDTDGISSLNVLQLLAKNREP